MAHFTRREFLKMDLPPEPLPHGKPSVSTQGGARRHGHVGTVPSERPPCVPGTGSISGQVQRDPDKSVSRGWAWHAYDRGIRFFETAESRGDAQDAGHRVEGPPA